MSFDETAKERASMDVASSSGGLSRSRNYTERLDDEIRSLKERLNRKRRLKTLLNENPAIQEALELMN